MTLPWKGICIHHSLTKDSQTVSWSAITRYHVKTLGWRWNGYHAGVELVGEKYEVLLGRPIDWVGSHAPPVNRTHLGVCFVGNYDLVEPPFEMLAVACERIIRPWMSTFGIPRENIEFHRDYSTKTCPGTKFKRKMLLDALDAIPAADY